MYHSRYYRTRRNKSEQPTLDPFEFEEDLDSYLPNTLEYEDLLNPNSTFDLTEYCDPLNEENTVTNFSEEHNLTTFPEIDTCNPCELKKFL